MSADGTTVPLGVRAPLASYWQIIRQAGASFMTDRAPSMGAALSYYTLFSLAPLLLIVIAVAGLTFGIEAARGQIFGQIASLVGADAAAMIQDLVSNAYQPEKGLFATLLGVSLMLFGATTVFGELQDALDHIWQAPAREQNSSWWSLLRSRLLSFGLILGIGFLLIVSLVMSAALAAFNTLWSPLFSSWQLLGQALDIIINFVLLTILFAMIYKWMPRVRIAWRDVLVGATCTAILFMLGRALIGQYIAHSSVASAFGAAGSIVVVMVWVYYSAQIFLFGAELTWSYAHVLGSLKDKPTGNISANIQSGQRYQSLATA